MITAKVSFVALQWLGSLSIEFADDLFGVKISCLEGIEVESAKLIEMVFLRRPPSVGDLFGEVFDPKVQGLIHLIDVWLPTHSRWHL